MPPDSFDAALSLAASALEHVPAGLLTDLDGTLAPIVRDPSAVRLADGAADALAALAARIAVVGVVSGRAAADVRRLVGVREALVAGNHGIEWLEPGSDESVAAPHLAEVPRALARLLSRVPAIAGIRIDDKRLSATVHDRNASEPSVAREAVLGALTAALEGGMAGETGIELREGRMSVELRPAQAGDKGTAVASVAERFALRGLVVLGDDLTDLDMFREAARLRDTGRLRAAIVAVAGDGEVPDQVAAAADATLDGPATVVRLLSELEPRAADAARRSRPDPPAGGAATS
jgi:trehalose 6-phosphate phosphatase